MIARHVGLVLAAAVGGTLVAAPALAQNEQFIPALVYRTGAYAPNGIPFANGVADYYNLINERDGGINGVKIVSEECEFGYATDRGVECYERLKGKGPTGAAYVIPLSTGVTFALTEKAPADKIPIISMGYGRSESRDGSVFQWNFPLLGTYWTAADIILQHIAKKEGGFDKLKGKKIALVYHDSPYGKEPIALLAEARPDARLRADAAAGHPSGRRAEGDLAADPPEPAGLCAALGLGRDELHRHQGSGRGRLSARQDVRRVVVGRRAGRAAGRGRRQGLQLGGAAAHRRPVQAARGPEEVRLRQGQGPRPKWEETGEILYIRGLINAMLGVEAIRTAQGKFGKKPLTGEQVRWGLENLNLTADRIKQLGFEGVMQPIKVSCADHEGTRTGRIQTWDGKNWKLTSDWITVRRQRDRARWSRRRPPNMRPRRRSRRAVWRPIDAGLWPTKVAEGAAAHAASVRDRQPLDCAAGGRASILSVNNIEVVYNHVILVLKGVSLAVSKGHRGALGRERRRQIHDAQGDIEPAVGRARGSHQGLDRLRRHGVHALTPNELVRRGCIQVMEGRHCFAHLTVEENLLTGAYTRRDGHAASGAISNWSIPIFRG